jgi:phosphoglycolate phosphatase
MYSTVVYDLDGTLVDSALTVAGLLNGLRAERDLPALPREAYTPWLSIGGCTMVAAALAIEESEAGPLLETFRARYLAQPTDPETVFPEVHATLSQLKRHGIRLALCTNKPRPLTEKVLAETGLAAFFEVICAGNDLATAKPHPDNLNLCLNALNSHAQETIVVGDSRVDQCLAEACGTHFALFSGGYDDGVHLNTHMIKINRHPEILSLFSPIEERPHCE